MSPVPLRRGWGVAGWLALLLWLVGCAAPPVFLGPAWEGGLRPVTLRPIAETAGSEHPTVEVDFEVLTPRRAEQLHQSGLQVPRVSTELGDPRAHRDFIDSRVTAVGFGLTEGGYVLYCEGLPLPVLVPETQVDLSLTSARALNPSIYPDREAALADLTGSGSGAGPPRYVYYRGAGGVLIVPTVFSPATTPHLARTMLEVRQQLAQTVQRELKVLLVSLAGTRVLQGVFSRVLRVGLEPASGPPSPQERLGSGAPTPQQPVPRASGTLPESALALDAPSGAPAPSSVPAPGPLAPSPGLVQVLTGHNTTRPVAAVPRLPQDVAVNPRLPKALETNRPISSSATQNAQLQADIEYLQSLRAQNIRVNQQQITVRNGQRVGTNRPDLQFDYNNRRYHIEYDTPTSGRGSGHQSRITSNDPNAETILLIVP